MCWCAAASRPSTPPAGPLSPAIRWSVGDRFSKTLALGWHRVQAATWLLACATSGVDKPATDPRHLVVLRRQLTSARELLAA